MSGLLFVAALVAALVGFAVLDRWHKRRAWREADRWAAEQMRLKYGANWKKPGDRK